MEGSRLTPELLLHAYSIGVFPMSEGRDDPDVFWVDPQRRGILPLDNFHISRSLARRIRSELFEITLNRDFNAVVHGCADREETWINPTIHNLYTALFEQGHAHSIEVWQDQQLVGGVYGVTLGGAFFGESMFSRRTDASKVALAYLTKWLSDGGFTLFDTQFITPHLTSLGAIEISRSEYQKKLKLALETRAEFRRSAPIPSAQEVLQRRAQTS